MIEKICLNCIKFYRKKKAPDKIARGYCGIDNLPTSVNWSCGKFQAIVTDADAKKVASSASS
jgi:hypothetical protein